MKSLKPLTGRLGEILERLDALASDEAMEELNAQLEDAIFYLESIDVTEKDAPEDFSGALEDIRDILEDYRSATAGRKDCEQPLLELDMALKLAAANW